MMMEDLPKEIKDLIKGLPKGLEDLPIWRIEYLVNLIKSAMRSVGALIVYFIGPRGSGKSISAISLCHELDPTFDSSRIGFTKEEIYDIFEENVYKEKSGIIVMWDEIGSELFSRDAMKKEQKNIAKLLQISRETGITLVGTLPRISMVDIVGYHLANYIIKVVSPVDMKQKYREGLVYEIRDDINSRGRRQLIETMFYGTQMRILFVKNHIPENIVNEYEKKKTLYVRSRLRKFKEDMIDE
jgi:hypothetical protein